ncbi:MAG: AEC family transporter [Promethearchaeia archaeon]
MNPNLVFFLSLTIILIGYVIKKAHIITEKEGEGIAKLILNVTLPALIFDVITTLELVSELFLLFFISLGFSVMVVSVGFVLFQNYDRQVKGILLMTSIGYNIGLFAYPIIEGIWGIEGLQHIALFDFGNAFVVFILCYVIAAIFSPKNGEDGKINGKYILKKLVSSAPLVSFIIAVILNLFGFEFPLFLSELIGVLSRANMALTLLLLGIYLNFKFQKSEWVSVMKVLAIRYGFGLTVGLILFFALPYSHLYRTILLVGLILPVGMATVPFAVEYKYSDKLKKLTGIIVNLTITISFALMWLITLIIA